MKIEELKKQIKERDKVTQKLRDKLCQIENEKYLKEARKVLGNVYLKTYGRGKEKEYSFIKITGLNKMEIETTEIYVSKRKRYRVSELTSGKKITRQDLFKQIKEILNSNSKKLKGGKMNKTISEQKAYQQRPEVKARSKAYYQKNKDVILEKRRKNDI